MSIIVTYMLVDSVSEQEKEFGALSAVADWVKGIGEDMFTSIEISNGYDNDITDFQTMHDIVQANKESEYQAYTAKCRVKPVLNVPQYMFKDKEVSPHTWIDIQNMQLDCYELGNQIALLINPITREYLYVFWDEAAQCSNPYTSYNYAIAACKRYMECL